MIYTSFGSLFIEKIGPKMCKIVYKIVGEMAAKLEQSGTSVGWWSGDKEPCVVR